MCFHSWCCLCRAAVCASWGTSYIRDVDRDYHLISLQDPNTDISFSPHSYAYRFVTDSALSLCSEKSRSLAGISSTKTHETASSLLHTSSHDSTSAQLHRACHSRSCCPGAERWPQLQPVLPWMTPVQDLELSWRISLVESAPSCRIRDLS